MLLMYSPSHANSKYLVKFALASIHIVATQPRNQVHECYCVMDIQCARFICSCSTMQFQQRNSNLQNCNFGDEATLELDSVSSVAASDVAGCTGDLGC